MPSNFPPGYSEDGDAIEHGRDSAIYQELRLVREKYQEWFRDFEHEFPNDECRVAATTVMSGFMEMEAILNQPL